MRTATQRDPARRPPTVDALLEIIAQELDPGPPDDGDIAGRLLAAASAGDEASAAQLFALAARHPDDVRLYTEVLPALPRDAVSAAVDADPQQASEVARAALGHIHDPDLGWADAARVITWLRWIAVRASEIDDLGLLEEALGALLTWDASWDQGTPQQAIRQWLARLRDDQAAAAARVLRDHGELRHFTELAGDRRADDRIRHAARPAPSTPPGESQLGLPDD